MIDFTLVWLPEHAEWTSRDEAIVITTDKLTSLSESKKKKKKKNKVN